MNGTTTPKKPAERMCFKDELKKRLYKEMDNKELLHT